jgi:DNA-binding ferritin-like protein (Dps family)
MVSILLSNYYYKLFVAIESVIRKRGDATTMDFPVRTSCTEAMEAITSNGAEQMVGDDVAQWVSLKGRLARLRGSAKALR